MKLSEIDQNLAVASELNLDGLVYRNAMEEFFDIYGLYRPRETGRYMRMPGEAAGKVSPGVRELSVCTAGGRIRFRTDSAYVAVKVRLTGGQRMPHMPLTGSHGLDLYVFQGGEDVYQGTFVPPMEDPDNFEGVVHFWSRGWREITIHLPLYSGVEELFIGLEGEAGLEPGRKYRPVKPVVYYGSSITQGGCASRPGNNYSAAISRETNVDFRCFGFSGGAKGEREMVDYLAGLGASVFVCDYDYNAPSEEHLRDTHIQVYQVYREKNPDIPVILVSRPNIRLGADADARRRDTVYHTYRRALEKGDRNVYYVDGFQLFSGRRRHDSTVDGTHPNDLGFFRMAEVIGEVVKYCLPGTGDVYEI